MRAIQLMNKHTSDITLTIIRHSMLKVSHSTVFFVVNSDVRIQKHTSKTTQTCHELTVANTNACQHNNVPKYLVTFFIKTICFRIKL